MAFIYGPSPHFSVDVCFFANLENCCIFAGAYLQGRVKFPIGGKSPRAEVSGRKAGTEAGTVGTAVPTVRSGRIFSGQAICRRLSWNDGVGSRFGKYRN